VAFSWLDSGIVAASRLDSGLLSASWTMFMGRSARKKNKTRAERFPNAKPNLILQNKIHKLPIAPCGPDVISTNVFLNVSLFFKL